MPRRAQTTRLSTVLTDLLPYLRRYARALTGLQTSGDRYAAATLQALLTDRAIFDSATSDKVALFGAFHRIWTKHESQNHTRLHSLTPDAREALLLKSIEGFSVSEIAEIMQADASQIEHLLNIARREVRNSVKGSILVIEDEILIALDLEDKIVDLGHQVFGTAHTQDQAVKMVNGRKPDMILSDIHLADGSSGIDAVAEITRKAGDIPVIFVTAFPERLLSGAEDEPAFVITKPYSDEQLRSAIGQAMLFTKIEAQPA